MVQIIKEAISDVHQTLNLEAEKLAARADEAAARMGLGTWNITIPADDHTGPTLTPQLLNQRQPTQKAVKRLAQYINRNGRQPYDHKNLLTVGIRSSWVDKTKLVKHTEIQTLGDHSRIPWTAEAIGKTAYLINGRHRIEANMILIKTSQLHLQKVTRLLNAAEDSDSPELQEKLDELNTAIEKQSFWGVELIDLGTSLQLLCRQSSYIPPDLVEKSKYRFQIEHNLASNENAQLADTQEQQFCFIATLLAKIAPEDRAGACASMKPHTHKGHIMRLLVDSAFREAMISLMRYKPFITTKAMSQAMFEKWTRVIGGVSLFITTQFTRLYNQNVF